MDSLYYFINFRKKRRKHQNVRLNKPKENWQIIWKGAGAMEKFKTWDEVRSELFTQEEIAESDLRVALMGELIKARKERGISQRELERLSGVKQPIIARIESGTVSPKLDTVMKLLAAMGKKLAIVPLG